MKKSRKELISNQRNKDFLREKNTPAKEKAKDIKVFGQVKALNEWWNAIVARQCVPTGRQPPHKGLAQRRAQAAARKEACKGRLVWRSKRAGMVRKGEIV